MIQYTIVEFREKMREAFNKADAGEEVYVTRYDQAFQLKPMRSGIPLGPGVNLLPDKPSSDVRPDISKIKSEATPEETDGFKVAGNVELPCCNQAKPCQHWLWNSSEGHWENTLSRRVKEVFA